MTEELHKLVQVPGLQFHELKAQLTELVEVKSRKVFREYGREDEKHKVMNVSEHVAQGWARTPVSSKSSGASWF